MKQELIVTGSTIEEALRNGAEQLGVMPEELKYEVLVEPKKGILGIGRVAAKLKVCYEEAEAPAEKTTSVAKTAPAKRTETAEENNVALRFVRTLLEDMELEQNPVNVSMMLEQIADEAYAVLAEKGLRCEVDIHEDLTVTGDADKLAAAMKESIENRKWVCGFPENVRGETLSIEAFAALSNAIGKALQEG